MTCLKVELLTEQNKFLVSSILSLSLELDLDADTKKPELKSTPAFLCLLRYFRKYVVLSEPLSPNHIHNSTRRFQHSQ